MNEIFSKRVKEPLKGPATLKSYLEYGFCKRWGNLYNYYGYNPEALHMEVDFFSQQRAKG